MLPGFVVRFCYSFSYEVRQHVSVSYGRLKLSVLWYFLLCLFLSFMKLCSMVLVVVLWFGESMRVLPCGRPQ